MSPGSSGKLVIVSGPSGAGKSTVLKEVFNRSELPLVWSVSATTRRPRPGEVDGEDYHFLSQQDFDRNRESGDFLECFEVFGRGYWYGTLLSEVTTSLQDGKWVVLEINVEGTMAALKIYPDAVTLFVAPAATIEESLAELERRLLNRGTESREEIDRRLDEARHELELSEKYDHFVVNNDIEVATTKICDILTELNDQ